MKKKKQKKKNRRTKKQKTRTVVAWETSGMRLGFDTEETLSAIFHMDNIYCVITFLHGMVLFRNG